MAGASANRVGIFGIAWANSDAGAAEDFGFRFAFKEKGTAAWPWVRFKDIVFVNNRLDMQIAHDVQKLAPSR